MSRFPTPGHLVSWAKFAPKARQSAGRSKAASTGKGNPWLGGTLGEAAAGAARTKTFLASRYKRIVRRRGKQRALVAVGNSILTIVWISCLDQLSGSAVWISSCEKFLYGFKAARGPLAPPMPRR